MQQVALFYVLAYVCMRCPIVSSALVAEKLDLFSQLASRNNSIFVEALATALSPLATGLPNCQLCGCSSVNIEISLTVRCEAIQYLFSPHLILCVVYLGFFEVIFKYTSKCIFQTNTLVSLLFLTSYIFMHFFFLLRFWTQVLRECTKIYPHCHFREFSREFNWSHHPRTSIKKPA